MKKTGLILVIGCSIMLTACSSSKKSAVETANATTTSVTTELTSSNEMEKITDTEPNATEGVEDIETDITEKTDYAAGGHKRIDSDIMERYAVNLLDCNEDELVYDDSGNLISVIYTDRRTGEEGKLYDFSYYDTGRVKEMIEYQSGSPFMIIDIERNEKGQKTTSYSKMSDGKGGFNETARMVTEYDESGNRTFDYAYTAAGEQQGTYRAYIYDGNGNRVEYQGRMVGTDEIVVNDFYEYDDKGRLVTATSYSMGSLNSKYVYEYEGDAFKQMTIYSGESDQTGIVGYDKLLPESLYELQDY